MQTATYGIVFNYIRYSDNAVIIKIFSQKYGLQSYFFNGLNRKKNKSQKACLQPLSIVELEATQHTNKNLQNLNSIKLATVFQTIPSNITKSAIVFFLAEVLSKTIKEEESNPALYDFISNSLSQLDQKIQGVANFHLLFLCKLTTYLGFQPQLESFNKGYCFDLQEGIFTKNAIPQQFKVDAFDSLLLFQAFCQSIDQSQQLEILHSERKNLLSIILNYYSIHNHNLNNLKTREVLEEIFS